MAPMPSISFLLLFLLSPTASADPEPAQDFCLPDPGSAPIDLARVASYPCKPPANVTAADFVFSGLRSPGRFFPETGFGAVIATPVLYPGLNTLGMSFARAYFEPGGVDSPHYHPRATETVLVMAGRLYAGFVDSGGRLFANVVGEGEVMVYPRGMIHFEVNVGGGRATIFASFNSQNPGFVGVAGTVFGSGIKEQVLEKAFGLSAEELERLRKRLGPK